MRITITKGEREDRIDALRADGSKVSTTFPHKGPVPHDVTHYIVERELGFAHGFWGLVASGRHPEEIAGLAKAAGHASAKRAATPEPGIIPVLQAERAVECFEADLWSGATGDHEMLRGMLAAGCEQSLVPAFPVTDEAIGRIRSALGDFRDRWAGMEPGETITLEWAGAQ